MDMYSTSMIQLSHRNYEKGLIKLREAIRNHKDLYKIFSNFENQLSKLLIDAGYNPQDDNVQNKINRVVQSLNDFCIDNTEENWSFNDLCNVEDIRITIIRTASSTETSDSITDTKYPNKIEFGSVEHLEKIVTVYTKDIANELYKPLIGVQHDEVADTQNNLGPKFEDIKVVEVFDRQSAQSRYQDNSACHIQKIWQERLKIVLIGGPGTGKTTTLKHLAIHVAQQNLDDDGFNLIPVWISLNKVKSNNDDLRALIQRELKRLKIKIARAELDDFILSEKCLFLFDGLNAMSPGVYDERCQDINDLIEETRETHCQFIISDRLNYDNTFPRFPVFELDKWDQKTAHNYVREAMKLLGNKQDPTALLQSIKNDKSLYSNPLQLGLLTSVYSEDGEIAPSLTELFKRFIEIRLEKKTRHDPVKPDIKWQLLTDLAFHAQQEQSSILEHSVLEQLLDEKLQELPHENYDPETALKSLLRDDWLQEISDDSYRFNFPIFQKFFAAYYLTDEWKKGRSVDEFISNPAWEESIVHVAGLLHSEAADEFTERVLELAGIELATRCGVNLDLSSPIRHELVTRLQSLLSYPSENERIEASRLLIDLHDESVQESLTRTIINDDEEKVKQNAVLALQRVMDTQHRLEDAEISDNDGVPSDKIFIKILDTDAYKDTVHVAACIALGRSKSQAATDTLHQALARDSQTVRNAAAISLAKIADDNIIDSLKRLIQQEQSPNAQAGALRTLQLVRPDEAKLLAQGMRAASDPNVKYEVDLILGGGDEKIINHYIQRVRTTTGEAQKNALSYLSTNGGTEIIQRADQDLKSTDSEVRKAALKILGEMKNGEDVLPDLTKALKDKSQSVRETASHLLIELGELAVPNLRKLFEYACEAKDSGLIGILCSALEGIGTRTAIQLLVDNLNFPNDKIVTQVRRSLTRTNQERARIILRETWLNTSGQENRRISELLTELETKYHEQLLIDYEITVKNNQQNVKHITERIMERIEKEIHSEIDITRSVAENMLAHIKKLQESEIAADSIARVNALHDHLRSPDPQQKEWAVEQLGKIKHESSLTVLVTYARNQDEALCVQIAAIKQLRHFSGEKVVSALTSLLKDSHKEIRSTALECLYKTKGNEADQALLKMFERNSSGPTYGALQARCQIEPSSAIFTHMVRLSVTGKSRLHRQASTFLDELKARGLPTDYKNILVVELTKNDKAIQEQLKYRFITTVRKESKTASRTRRETAAKQIVRFIARNEYLDQAIETLLYETDRKLVQIALIDNLSSKNSKVIQKILALFDTFPLTTVPAQFASLLNHKDSKISAKVAHLLSRLTDPNAVDLLVKCLNHPHQEIQKCAVTGLIRHELPQATIELVNFAKRTKNHRLRQQITRNLSHVHHSKVIDFLIEMLNHDDRYTKILAAQALVNQPSAEINDKLLESLDKPQPLEIRLLGQRAVTKSVPRLQGLLRGSQAPNIRQAAALSLLQISFVHRDFQSDDCLSDVQESLLSIRNKLQHPKSEIRVQALKQIMIVQADILYPYVATMLEDDERKVRLQAVETLSTLGTVQTIPHLVRVAADPDHKVQDKALAALCPLIKQPHLADKAIDAIVYWLCHPEKEFRRRAIQALIDANSPVAAQHLLQAVDEVDNELREKVIQHLATHPWDFALPHLQAARKDPHKPIRDEAKQTVAHIERQIIDKLSNIIQGLQSKADFTDLNMEPTPSAKPLLQALDAEGATRRILNKKRGKSNQHNAAHLQLTSREITLLGWLGHPASYQPLLDALWSLDKKRRLITIWAVGNAGLNAALPDLLTFLRSADIHEKEAAIYAIAKLGGTQAVGVLTPLLQENSQSIRLATLNILAHLGHTPPVEAVVQAIDSSDKKVALAAIKICIKLQLAEAIPQLLKKYHATSGRAVRIGALQALIALKPPASEAELRALFHPKKQSWWSNFSLARLNPLHKREEADGADPQLEFKYIYDLLVALQEMSVATPFVIDWLVKYAQDDRERIQVTAIDALSIQKSDTIPSILENLLKSEQPDSVYFTLLRAIAKIKPESSLPILNRAFQNATKLDRKMWLLKLLTQPKNQPFLEEELQKADFVTHLLITEALQQLRAQNITGYSLKQSPQRYLQSNSSYLQREAIQWIGRQQLGKYVRHISSHLRQENDAIILAVLESLGNFKLPGTTIKIIIGLTRSDNRLIRRRAIETLGRSRAYRALSHLERQLNNQWTRYDSAIALTNLGSRSAIKILKPLFAQEQPTLINYYLLPEMTKQPQVDWSPLLLAGLQNSDPEVRHMVVKNLVHFPVAMSTPVIRQALRDVSQKVVYEAIDMAGLMEATALIPELEKILDRDPYQDSYMISRAVRALGRLQASNHRPTFAKFLDSPIWQLAESTANAFGQLKEPGSVQALLSILERDDEHGRVEVAAIRSLAKIGTDRACTGLGNLQSQLSEDIRDEALYALRFFQHDRAIPILEEALDDNENHFIREHAVKTLSLFADVKTVAGLTRLATSDDNIYVRLAALDGLEQIIEPIDTSPLACLMDDPDERIRVKVIQNLYQSSPEAYQEQLIKLLGDESPRIREAILDLFYQNPPQSSYGEIADLVRFDPIPDIRDKARSILESVDTEQSKQVLQDLNEELDRNQAKLRTKKLRSLQNRLKQYSKSGINIHNDDEKQQMIRDIQHGLEQDIAGIRVQAAAAAARCACPELTTLFETALEDRLSRVRSHAFRGLAKIATEETLTIAYTAFKKETDVTVRLTLMRGLSAKQPIKVVMQILKEAVKDPNPKVAKGAIAVLRTLSHEDVTPVLISVLQDQRLDAFTRESAVTALGEIGATEALPAIRKATKDSSWYVRQDAITAAVKLGDEQTALAVCEAGLKDESLYVRRTAIDLLLEKNNSHSLPLLEQYIDHETPIIRAKALKGIAKLHKDYGQQNLASFNRSKLSARLMIQWEGENDLHVRIELIQTLEELNPTDLTKFVEENLFTTNTILRRRFLQLGEKLRSRIDYVKIEQIYLTGHKNLHVKVRRDISSLIKRYGKTQCIEMLRICARDSDRSVKVNAAQGLRFIDDQDAISSLQKLLRDPDDKVRDTAYQSLQHIATSRKRVTDNLTDPVQASLASLQNHFSHLTNKEPQAISQEVVQSTRRKTFHVRFHAILSVEEHRLDRG